MSVVKIHVENKVYVIFTNRLEKSLSGSRLDMAINHGESIDPKMHVVYAINDDNNSVVTDVYLDTSLTAWKRVWNLINADRDDEEDFKYFVELRVKPPKLEDQTDESNFVEISNELLSRFKDDGDDSDDYEGYHVNNLEELIKISRPSPDLIYGDEEDQEPKSNNELGEDIDTLIKSYQTKMSQQGSVSTDVINALSSNPELNQLLKTQLGMIEEDSPTDSLDLTLDPEETSPLLNI
jgi:hypothetical protein